MAKKRKSAASKDGDGDSAVLDIGASKKRIRDYTDVADSDDEFHLNRDKVLLEEAPIAKKRRKWEEQDAFLEPSDEEVLQYSGSEEEDEASDEDLHTRARATGPGVGSASEDEQAEDEDEEFRWGTSRDDVYGADEIETEEQALAEEAEALRLQQKQLQGMTAADYGFDESTWQDKDADVSDVEAGTVTEVLPPIRIDSNMSAEEKSRLFRTRYPEFEPLQAELLRLHEVYARLTRKLDERERETYFLSNLKTQWRAAGAYLGALTMYSVLLTSTAADGKSDVLAMPPAQLQDHPVMEDLIACRELWQKAEVLEDDYKVASRQAKRAKMLNGHESDIEEISQVVNTQHLPVKKSRAQRHAEAAQAADDVRKAERLQRTERDLADLDTLLTKPRKGKSAKLVNGTGKGDHDDSADEEDAPLTAQEAAEKAKRKKGLRFYTSQIAQKANKRRAASRNAGGDDDIPHRERLRDRQTRLNAEAEKRGRKDVAADARTELGGESDEDDAIESRQTREEIEADEYMDLIKARTTAKKSEKAALAEARKQAELQGGRVVPQETVGADGKRKITYAIEKNKGLTPHRKKDVRNPRVKKRKKYAEKTKKLASMKPVYKGAPKGGYGGELSGISSNLVRSTKL